MGGKTPQALWQDYRFLTKEMLKFINNQDMDLFYELLNQRDRMQVIIEQTVDDGFKVSPAGQSLLSEIQRDNQYITENLQFRFNRIKRSHQVSEVYNYKIGEPVSRKNWDI